MRLWTSPVRHLFTLLVPALLVGAGGEAHAAWKVAHWNVMSGFGKAGPSGVCSFTCGSNCATNAWGDGRGPLAQTLVAKVKNDPQVVALTVNEGWSCATPNRIRSLLGWAAVEPADYTHGEVQGVGIVARYGFAGRSTVQALPRCTGSPYQRYVVHAPVYVDAARTKVVQLFATHWSGCDAEGPATVDFMQRWAWKPRTLTGDFNSKDPTSSARVALRNANYNDVWPRLYGTTSGYTSTWNNASANGDLYKRIDLAYAKQLEPLGMARFNTGDTNGACVQSDHAGIVVTYADLP